MKQMTMEYYLVEEDVRITVILMNLLRDLEKKEKIIVKDWCRQKGYDYNDCKKACRKGDREGKLTLTWGGKGYYVYKKNVKDKGILDKMGEERFSMTRIIEEIRNIMEELYGVTPEELQEYVRLKKKHSTK